VRRTGWVLLALLAAACGALFVARPRPLEPFPLAERVPADVLLYAGFQKPEQLESLGTPWSEELRKRLEPARTQLTGAIAVYIDREGEWVALLRLTTAASLLSGAEVDGDAAVFAQSPATLARHKARQGSLADQAEFQSLGSRVFVNLEPLKLPGRLGDYSALGVDVMGVSPLHLRGRALYKPGVFRTYLEQYVQAPRHGGVEGVVPLQAALTESFPRVWDEILQGLPKADADKADRESQVLSRDYLDGRPFREFLGRLGPGWSVSIAPTSYGKPALTVSIDLPDEGTRETASKMVQRAIADGVRIRRDKGLTPLVEVEADGPVYKVKVANSRALRYGESFSPAFTFGKSRFVFSTCAALLDAPPPTPGDVHASVAVDVPTLLQAVRALATLQADEKCRSGLKPGLSPAEEARALEELSKTLPWQEELTRVNASIEAWADRLSWLERASASGRFTSEGLDFEVEARRSSQK
jgi:hypothetical protein